MASSSLDNKKDLSKSMKGNFLLTMSFRMEKELLKIGKLIILGLNLA
jgi:hypothetical protein